MLLGNNFKENRIPIPIARQLCITLLTHAIEWSSRTNTKQQRLEANKIFQKPKPNLNLLALLR